jgi:hypothetical protein
VADAATDTILVSETFGAQTSPANFGFPAGAAVAGGVLNVTQGMKNYPTSVTRFDTAVVATTTLDLSFDWKTAIASSARHPRGDAARRAGLIGMLHRSVGIASVAFQEHSTKCRTGRYNSLCRDHSDALFRTRSSSPR